MKALSFYIERSGPVHALNPLTKSTAVLVVIVAAFTNDSWISNTVIFAFTLAPLSVIAGVGRTFAKSILRLFTPFFIFLFLVYSLCFPVAPDEAIVVPGMALSKTGIDSALEIGARVLIMLSSFTLLFLTTHPGRLLNAMVEKGVPWRLAFLISSTLQILPMMQATKDQIIEAQKSRGLKISGGPLARIRGLFPLIAPLVYSSIIAVEQRAIALEARGFSRNGPRTSLEEIPDAPWERFVRLFFLGTALFLIGRSLWQFWN